MAFNVAKSGIYKGFGYTELHAITKDPSTGELSVSADALITFGKMIQAGYAVITTDVDVDDAGALKATVKTTVQGSDFQAWKQSYLPKFYAPEQSSSDIKELVDEWGIKSSATASTDETKLMFAIFVGGAYKNVSGTTNPVHLIRYGLVSAVNSTDKISYANETWLETNVILKGYNPPNALTLAWTPAAGSGLSVTGLTPITLALPKNVQSSETNGEFKYA